ncbi:MAG: sn-glycerol-1-phosphate dehydrogenase [Devosia sp.]
MNVVEKVREDTIEQLLAGTYVDPDTGKTVGVTTKFMEIAPSLAGMESELIEQLGFGRTVAVVSDKNTHEVMGARIERAIGGRHQVVSVVLPDGVHPDGETVEKVRAETAGADALIAVGSGTINDLSKYASAQDKKPYAVFGTAPSMNGYTSVNAAITMHGHKMSLPAHAPVGAFFDLAILSAAPTRLIRAGLGDSLCRTTSQADWLLAHLLFGKPYRKLPYALLKNDEGPLFAQSAALVRGDRQTMERLVRTLNLSGFGTAIVGNSEPASQGEHLISHYIDMFADPSRPLIYHGEQIAVTTLSMARLQHKMLDGKPVVKPDTQTEADFIARYGAEIGKSCWSEFSKKRLDADKAEAVNARISDNWNDIVEKVSAVLLPTEHLHAVMSATGADLTPEKIHLSRSFYEKALLRCREIRNRYTFLDLASDTGAIASLTSSL